MSGRQSPAAGASPVVSSQVAPSPAPLSSAAASVAVVPSSTATASLPSPSATPPRSLAAGPVLEIVDRLLDHGAGLEAEVEKSGTVAPAIAELLRAVNASIVAMDEPLLDLAADSSTGDLASRIRVINTTTSDAVRRTQRSTIRNEEAYRQGAEDVILALEPLTAIREELATLAGETP
jgi:hypothetical protein